VKTPVGQISTRFPVTGAETGGFIGEDTGRADVDEIAGKGRLQLTIAKAAVVDPSGAPHDPEIAAAGIFLIKADAAVALDAAVHFMGNVRSEILVAVGPLPAVIATDALSAGDGEILQLAFPPFVADRAVMGVVDHQPFEHLLAHRHCLGVGRRNDHPLLGREHAGHLQTLYRAGDHLDCADPAGAGLSQRRMPAEVGDRDIDCLCRFENSRPFRHLNRYVVYN